MTETKTAPRATYDNEGETVEIPIRIKVSEYLLVNIIVTAIESGIHGIGGWSPKQRLRSSKFPDAFDPKQDKGPKGGLAEDIVVIDMNDYPDQVWDEFIARNVAIGGTLTIYEDADEERNERKYVAHTLTKAKLIEGLAEAVIQWRGATLDVDSRTGLTDIDIDGPMADYIIQHALFGKQVYE